MNVIRALTATTRTDPTCMRLILAKQEAAERRLARHERQVRARRKADKEWCRISIHEGGHAVVCTLVGHGVHNVWVDPERPGPLHGECIFIRYDWPQEKLPRAMACLAGGLAEFYAKIRREPSYNGSDWDDAVALVGRYGIPEAETRAGRLLVDHWPAVRALADALVEHGELSGSDVRSLVGENSGWNHLSKVG